jgi:hypothetical protein
MSTILDCQLDATLGSMLEVEGPIFKGTGKIDSDLSVAMTGWVNSPEVATISRGGGS